MCQQPVIYQYVCYPPPTKKELYFLNKVIGIEGGGVRNFVFFFCNRHAGDKQLWLSVKRQFKQINFRDLGFCFCNLMKKEIVLNCKLMSIAL